MRLARKYARVDFLECIVLWGIEASADGWSLPA
jgi:hypothetical protein